MERSIEWFLALTSLVIGASHIVCADAWIEAYGLLHRLGRPGAFINGAMSLLPGAVVARRALTAFGWLLVAKGVMCFLAPGVALRSMERAPSRAGFVVAGVVLMAVGGWAGCCAWHGGGTA